MRRKKLFTAVTLLLVCAVLLVAASFAWISLATAPEVAGIDIQVSANGSLEMALLSTKTYADLSEITTGVGSSQVVQETTVSNLSWGNVVDLADPAYGLNQISLLPARLSVTADKNGEGIVNSGILTTPEFFADGRIGALQNNLASATYQEDEFLYDSTSQSYGVRAVGTLSDITPQQAGLAGARVKVKTYTSSAVTQLETVWSERGAALLSVLDRHYGRGGDSYDSTDVAQLKKAAQGLQTALNYLDGALRQGIIGYGATVIEDATTYSNLRTVVEMPEVSLSLLLGQMPMELPTAISSGVARVEEAQAKVTQAIAACDALTGSSFGWGDIAPIVDALLSVNGCYMNDSLLSDQTAYTAMTADNILTLTPTAGVMATIVDFAGIPTASFTYREDLFVELDAVSLETKPWLTDISDTLEEREAITGQDNALKAPLEEIYGFALDFAFRCNQESELLLQTESANRVDNGIEDAALEGGGSYMSFTSGNLTETQMIALMDAIRVAFTDDQGALLGVAKLNTSNYTIQEDALSAPLYLYDYDLTAGYVLMGERRTEDVGITTLAKNVPKTVTVIVWLDGDYILNSFVSIGGQTMTGVLNLQFATSAGLEGAAIRIDT